jgi:hypothetical protein
VGHQFSAEATKQMQGRCSIKALGSTRQAAPGPCLAFDRTHRVARTVHSDGPRLDAGLCAEGRLHLALPVGDGLWGAPRVERDRRLRCLQLCRGDCARGKGTRVWVQLGLHGGLSGTHARSQLVAFSQGTFVSKFARSPQLPVVEHVPFSLGRAQTCPPDRGVKVQASPAPHEAVKQSPPEHAEHDTTEVGGSGWGVPWRQPSQ